MRRWLAVVVLVVGCAPAGPPPSTPTPPPSGPPATKERPRYTVHVTDVGTGLGVFVEGEDFTLVYDAGSNDDLAIGEKNRFVAYVRAVRPDLKKIDHVVLSHPHRDHVELLADVVTTWSVSNVWDSGAVNDICGYRRFLQAVADSPGTVYHSAAHDPGAHVIDFGKELCKKFPPKLQLRHGARVTEDAPITLGASAKMTFLHVDGETHANDFNESSLVTLLELDGAKVLVMGDAEAGGRDDPGKPPSPKSVEGRVLAKYRDRLRSDVLVVGHHGSKSSSRKAFVETVAPKVSVISSGPTQYAKVVLPDPEIRDELRAIGDVFETDVDDEACAKNPNKVGPDADDRPGGCDNVQIKIQGGALKARYARFGD